MAREAYVKAMVDHFDSWPAEPGENRAGSSARMSAELYPYEKLFSPIQINRMTVKNRIVMPPMGNIDMCEETGRPNDMMLNYFFERAKGGTGLLTTGLIPISHGVDPTVTELGKLSYFPRIDRSRTVFSGWRDLAQGVHAYGGKIFVQLTAGLGRVGNPQCLLTQYRFPQSASFNPNFYIPQIPSVRISDRKLNKIINNTGQASADAKAMGIDGVYLHGHEGYLIEQMTNPAFNRRRLGRYTNWMSFGLDMVREIRLRVGPHYPIMYRIDLSLALEETYDDQVLSSTYLKKFRGGRTLEMTLSYMEELVKAGVDLFDVDLGCYDNWWLPHPPSSMPAGCFLDIAAMAKKHFADRNILSNAGVPVPIVAVGKLGYPDVAERALREERCDMVMLGRPLLADPQWPNKAFAGKVDSIRPCIGCQEGCINEFVEAGHPQCAVNPRTSFEYKLPAIPVPAPVPKRIAVVGGGPGGVITAVTAAARGHRVDLYEKSPRLGGRIVPGSVARIKFDVANYLSYLERLVEQSAAKDGLSYYPGTEATAMMLEERSYDTIVYAVGTQNAKPPVPGIDHPYVIQAVDLFQDPTLVLGKQNIVVIGGGVVGCEMAQWLAVEHDKDVTVVEMQSHFMEGVCTANRGHLLHAMKAKGVRLLNLAQLMEVHEDRVTVRRNVHKNVPDPYNSWSPILPENIPNPLAPLVGEQLVTESIPADLVVLAAGGRADQSLYFEAQQKRIAPELYNIGDSFSPGKIQEAVRAAYRLGISL